MIESSTDIYDTQRRVRPIALLEAFRKYVTRVITKRLSKVCIKKNILQGPNFAGLPEDSIEKPIYILNALLEEA
ncbi:24093_t:CDS:2 [Gigaspora margarita]|uniref:24093_t:CDS:1 n=1 Tax=Gigaspora margarita TaxID=4874 RepID=A0ABN7UMM5_GIGMA|nr:24093_t:CDS:2 [Gigaspora margarita]